MVSVSITDGIALAALAVSILSLSVGVVSIVLSIRTSRRTTDQLTYPRVKVLFSQRQDANYGVPATVLTISIQNVSTIAHVLNPKVNIHFGPFPNALERNLRSQARKYPILCSFNFSDLAPGDSQMLSFPQSDANSGHFERKVAQTYPSLLISVERGVKTNSQRYRVTPPFPLSQVMLSMFLILSYTPGISGAGEQTTTEEHVLIAVTKTVDGGNTDLLERWDSGVRRKL